MSGRRVNDSMGNHIANQFVKELAKEIALKNQKILILGITFKEDCPDIRNSKVIDIIDELKNYNLDIEVLDPLANIEEVKTNFQLIFVIQ